MKSTYPVKVSSQGQITLPKALRQKLGARKGQVVYIHLEKDDSIKIQTTPPITKFRGALTPKAGQSSVSETIQEIRRQQRKKLLES